MSGQKVIETAATKRALLAPPRQAVLVASGGGEGKSEGLSLNFFYMLKSAMFNKCLLPRKVKDYTNNTS